MDIATIKTIIAVFAAIGYFTSAILYWTDKRKFAYIANGAGWLLNSVIIGINWINNGYMPFVSMYQVVTFLGICFTLTYLYFHFVNKQYWMAKYFSICSGIIMIGAAVMNPTVIWHLAPALQSVWFIPHVFAYMLSYSLCTVASILAVIWYFNKNKRDEIEGGIYNLVLIAFPFMTFGMLSGAIWANEAWSEFWSWDIKENWSLVTWLCYGTYLHCRFHKSFKKLKNIFVILGLIALLITFQGVSLFGASSPHSYT